MLAAFTTNLFNSSFSGFHYSGSFGLLRESNILFKSTLDILNNITIFLPTESAARYSLIFNTNGITAHVQIFLGVVGGALGSLFVFLNLKLVRFKDWLEKFSCNPRFIKILKGASL